MCNQLAALRTQCLPDCSLQHYATQTAQLTCRDFDPFSLRMELPGAVAALAQNAAANGGTAYVHCTGGCCVALCCAMLCCAMLCCAVLCAVLCCWAVLPGAAMRGENVACLGSCPAAVPCCPTPSAGLPTVSPPSGLPGAAGLGRAPATALAWMWWFKDWHLEDAYAHLTGALCGLQCARVNSVVAVARASAVALPSGLARFDALALPYCCLRSCNPPPTLPPSPVMQASGHASRGCRRFARLPQTCCMASRPHPCSSRCHATASRACRRWAALRDVL